jgi:hypothetical protein
VGRLPNLTAPEETAVRDFVNKIVARGEWDLIIEIFCFSLNQTDSLTGFKDYTSSLNTPGDWTHSVDGWFCSGTTSIETTIQPSVVYDTAFGFAGVFIHSLNYTGTGNFDPFGTVDGASEVYCRHRGNDTNDWNIRFLTSGNITPRPSLAQANVALNMHTLSYESPDVHSYWLNGTRDTQENRAAGTIPATTIYINGRNNGGTQNARSSGYCFYFMSKPGISMPDFYNDVLVLLQDLGVSGV